jgi:transcriptional regulator with XRE-family HTH domain
VAKGEGRSDDPHVLLLERLRAVLAEEIPERRRGAVAKAAGIDPSKLTRLLNGQSSHFTVDLVVKLDEALGRPHGWLLRAAGYVQDPQTLEEAIEADPRLSKEEVNTVKFALRLALGEE